MQNILSSLAISSKCFKDCQKLHKSMACFEKYYRQYDISDHKKYDYAKSEIYK